MAFGDNVTDIPTIIQTSSKTELITFLNDANKEAEKLEAMFYEIAETHRHMKELERRPLGRKTLLTLACISISISSTFLLFIVPVCISFGIRSRSDLITMVTLTAWFVLSGLGLALGIFRYSSVRKKHWIYIENEWQKVVILSNEAEAKARKCVFLPGVPEGYRTQLALKTMLRYLMNGQAESWRDCSLLYDQQVHRWTLERNTAEALELQRRTMTMAELAAQNSGRAATAAAISAASSILRWL